jgi:Holliday junction DNA helicase RuvA
MNHKEVNAGARSDAIEALTALGYSASESMKAVNAVEITEDMSSDTILKLALQMIEGMHILHKFGIIQDKKYQ